MSLRTIGALWILAVVSGSISARAQDAATGLGRIYFQPAPGQFDQFLAAEALREKLPVVVAGTQQTADCVMAWVGGPTNLAIPVRTEKPGKPGKSAGQFVLVDLRGKSIVWGFRVRERPFDNLKDATERKLAAEVVGKLRHDGAFCGGSPFGTPMQNAEDRVKAFKPPVFEVPW